MEGLESSGGAAEVMQILLKANVEDGK